MSEKQTEYLLRKILNNLNIDYYNSPSENRILKQLFKKSSKNKTNKNGKPDLLIFQKNIIFIFECKFNNLKKAIEEAKFYANTLKNSNYVIYYCGFVSNEIYEIYDENNKKINDLLEMFLIKIFLKDNNKEMNISKNIHLIHNYIRNHTKISNEDKALFVGGILLVLKNAEFHNLFNHNITKDLSLCIQLELKKYNIDIHYIYETLNNEHLCNLINLIKNVLDKNLSIDVLNCFYNEFIKYNNTDGKNLGIVLTPPHIVEYMIKMLNISQDDVFLDLCSGTGSFLCEAFKYNPKKLIACEYQKKLFELLKINSILRENKFHCINNNCFDEQFIDNNNMYISKSAINPPYGMKDKNELDFIIKQLNCCVENGLCCSIIPISKLNYSKQRNFIAQIAKIKQIVICNDNLFYPNAGVKCCILLLEKNKNGHDFDNDIVEFIDYRNDGYEIKRNYGLIKSNEEKIKKFNIYISEKLEWNYCDIDFNFPLKMDIQKKLLFLDYQKKLLELNNTNNHETYILSENIKNKTIDELFYILKKPRIEYKTTNHNIKDNVFVISAKNNNNGIKEISISDKNTFFGNKIVLITGGDGGAGLAYYQESPFKITSATIVLEPKFNMDKETGIYIALFLSNYKKLYNRGYQWKIDRIKHTIIK